MPDTVHLGFLSHAFNIFWEAFQEGDRHLVTDLTAGTYKYSVEPSLLSVMVVHKLGGMISPQSSLVIPTHDQFLFT